MKHNVLITGASGGIGAAISRKLAKDEHNLILCYYKNELAAQTIAAQCTEKGSHCLVKQADLCCENQIKALIEDVHNQIGPIDILINNAGISYWGLLQDMTAEEWDTLFAVNVRSFFLTAKYILPSMIHSGYGRIVNISSMWGQIGASCEVAYSATKGAIIAMTKALAKESGPSGITVNCVAPGVIDTPMNAAFTQEAIADLESETPVGRIGTPEDIASMVKYLVSPEASFITGQVIGVNGGFVV